MSGIRNGIRDEYTFKKLQGSHNSKQWTPNMSCAVEKTKHWRHLKRTAVEDPSLEAKSDDDEDQMERIYIQEENTSEFQDNAFKAVAKMGKICIYRVQKEFLSVKASREWTAKELWRYLKT